MRTPLDVQALDDAELLERARTGDRPAFGELVRRHRRPALRLAAVISGSTEEANDIVQEACVRMHRSLGTWRGTGSVRSWMLRIVANTAKNHVRSRVRRLRRDDRHAGLELRSVAASDEPAIARIEHEQLAGALSRLRADDRAVLGCRFIADLGERDTAEVLGIARGTVKSRTARALDRLRRELEVST